MIKHIEEISCAFLHRVDLICLSHLRWRFVFQRPQHLMTRFARYQRVFFFEEPVFGDEEKLNVELCDNVRVITPQLKNGLSAAEIRERQRYLLNTFIRQMDVRRYFLWYYTPMAQLFSNHLTPELIVYDCMDELSAFKFAPPELKLLEQELFSKADIVFTGGQSIYEAKKNKHHNIFPFPSSIDKQHFGKARTVCKQPTDQKQIAHPRFGFFGVVDERFDIDLIATVAAQKPEWQFIILGPVVKIDPASLPKYSNIHYPGIKCYEELPQYIAGWDIAMIPFAMNESTKFISPTKTPEYLAAGKPVISTAIKDVISPYGDKNLVHIISSAAEFIAAGEKELKKRSREVWLKKVDDFLADNSWDRTWSRMVQHIETTLLNANTTKKQQAYV